MKNGPTRRQFMKQGFAATTLLASGATLPSFLGQSARAAAAANGVARDGSVLVVIELNGGNDGLNTVVPFRDDAYYAARPTLAVPRGDVLPLDGDIGLHPSMGGLKRLFDDGRLAVIGNVGYPNPNRSHFRSMDIWHTAATSPESRRTGWLGRAADRTAQGGGSSEQPRALHLDDASLPLALHARDHTIPSVRDITSFRLPPEANAVEEVFAAARSGASDDLEFVRRLGVTSCKNARRLEKLVRDGNARGKYPDHALGARLRQIAQLVGADFGPRIYYTSLGGFDTHSRQALVHPGLLATLSDSIAAFYSDLEARGIADRVVLMTFSEFGRRVNENGSLGTDHGAAAPMFVAGPRCRPGCYGGRPNLDELVDGDVAHTVDFRSVYSGMLEDVLGCDPHAVLGDAARDIESLSLVRRG